MTSAGPCWERQRGESERAYSAFLLYRDFGPARSLDRVAETLAGGEHRVCTGCAPIPIDRLKKLSGRHAWVDRARAWDNHLQRERDRVMAACAAEWERRRIAALEEAWENAERLRAKADKMLAFPIQRTTIERDAKGRETTIIEPTRWTFMTAASMIRMAAEIQAAVLAAVDKDLGEMTDAELQAVAGAAGSPSPAPAND